MATLDTAARILPRPAAPRRSRRAGVAPTAPRLAVPRRRSLRDAAPGLSGEQVDTLVLKGLIWASMGGMVLWSCTSTQTVASSCRR